MRTGRDRPDSILQPRVISISPNKKPSDSREGILKKESK